MKPTSERARILRAVLDFVDRDDWDQGNGFMIFGSDAYDRHLGLELETDHNDDQSELLWKLALALKNGLGHGAILRRISLVPADANRIFAKELESFEPSLTDQQKSSILSVLTEFSKDTPLAPSNAAQRVSGHHVAIDAVLARRAVEQLDVTFQRVLTYDEVAVQTSTFDGSEYFEEAHRCDFNGHRIAAAVLCRAVLERALIDATDNTGWISGQKPSGESYIELMLRQATLEGKIDGSRFTAGLLVRDAGNAAIHQLEHFHNEYETRIPEIIDHTRKILQDLFEPRAFRGI